MSNWLRPFLMMFYAPLRGMGEVRERAPLGAAALLAFVAQGAYTLYAVWPVVGGLVLRSSGFALFGILKDVAFSLLITAIVFVPVTILVANLFERRASFGLAMQQDYAATAAAVFYAYATANLAALPFQVLARVSGFERTVIIQSEQNIRTLWAQRVPPEALAEALDPQKLHENVAFVWLLPFLAFLLLLAVREVFRLSWLRTVLLLVLSIVVAFPASAVLSSLSPILTSPFLLIILFLLMRGYIGEVTRQHRARASFKQNLEASTLNPADSSAHYNLGLLHLNRKELDEARARFERAVEIDPDEVDAHYQLGRVARTQGRLPDAVKHFEQVVVRDQSHSQHEIWREIGATYIAAEQYADALDALERFLAHREADPEGLYLAGRALAGMGRRREAKESMQACIEAVRTAPAYKYRAEKRWLNEAQQFLRTQA